MKPRKTTITLQHHEVRPVSIVADACISTVGVHGGRVLPVLLLDTSNRADIAELIRIHGSFEPGDVTVQWGHIDGHDKGTVALFLRFIRPMELFVALEFDIVKQGILVELALAAHGLYLTQANDPDDRLMKDINRPKIIVEIPDTGYRDLWYRKFHQHVAAHYRNLGLGRVHSRRAARSVIEELRKFGGMRLRDQISTTEK
jgi:hypothetical protein